ncbi:succinate dehydrogenase [Rhodococcus sp. NPDC003318]|uniref:succinate dehydrogenase n=1 Tax=Rhodococcus sp. NPDC003318 TaxID=3364503 RepID=UPI0036AA18B7
MSAADTVVTAPTPPRRAPAHRPRPSNVTCKVIMALTGVLFALFVLAHMIGNLKVFTGAQHFNDYAHWLRTVFEPLLPYEGLLWILRVVLLVAVVGHVWCAVLLTLRARRARGPFRRKGLGWRSFTARTMPVTGVVLLAFVVFHILDLTTGTPPVGSAAYEPATRNQNPGQRQAHLPDPVAGDAEIVDGTPQPVCEVRPEREHREGVHRGGGRSLE